MSIAIGRQHGANSPLPQGWELRHLGDVAQLNPRRPADLARDNDAPTTFVPMSAVDETSGTITRPESRPFAEVKKGYTYFAEDDVLFAKITPCMQNGKHAIARDLIDGVGFGSTEFHVLRPGPCVIAEWIHFYLRQPSVLRAAMAHFTGAVGQQRVPDYFLENLAIPLPPLPEQQRISRIVREQLAAVERARQLTETQVAAARMLPESYLRVCFSEDLEAQFRSVRLGDCFQLRRDVVHPRDNPRGSATFVGLEHIESGTGLRTGSVELNLAELTGRKPRFCRGDIVYGYLRPYLNKVWVAEFDGVCSVDQYVFIVDQEKADADFLAWFMRSPAYLARAPIDTTPGQLPRIRTDEVASVEVSLPSPEEQRSIVATVGEKMQVFRRMQAALEERYQAIEFLVGAILRRTFSGGV